MCRDLPGRGASSLPFSLMVAGFPGEGQMKRILLLGLALLIGACSSVSPVAISTGDVCFRCRQPIVDVKLAAEAIGQNGLVMKFRTVKCLAQHLSADQSTMAGVFVTDYVTGRFLRPETATFVHAPVTADTWKLEYVAFGDLQRAVAFGEQHGTKPVDWSRVVQMVHAETATN
jgi:hypothetical protein